VADFAARRRMPPDRRRRTRPPFRPDIEGLRAVAVLAVVAFHVGAADGGFVGVDVFFVISGFLITGLLWAELASTGRLRLARFYAARARRLLPAAAVVLLATAAAATAILPPLQARSVLDDGLASALYAGNYRFAVTGTDYLANGAPSPFQHYWSLGVEEQFYLLMPGLMLAGGMLLRRGRTAYLATLIAVGTISLILSIQWTYSLPPWAFFSLPTRAWELAAGGLVALSVPMWRRLPPGAATLTGIAGLGAVGAAVVGLDERTAYPGTAALLPVLGTVAAIGAGCARPVRGAGRLLAIPALRSVGRLSYSWYLWHWPVLVLAPALIGQPLGWMGRAAAVVSSLVLAVLTLRFIERPIRYARPLRASAGRSLALGSAITAIAAIAALMLPVLVRSPVGRGAPATAAVVRPADHLPNDPLAGVVAAARSAVDAAARTPAVPADLSPPLDDVAADKPSIFFDGCVRYWRETGVPDCVTGDPEGSVTVALVGDSHAAMWYPAMDMVAQQRHWRLSTVTKVTCPLQDLPITSPYLGRHYSECEEWRQEALAKLAAERPRLVVLSMSRRYGADFGFTSYDPAWIESLTGLVAELRATTGARVLVLGPVPDPHTDVPVCLSGHLADALACAPQRSAALSANGIAAEIRAVGAGGGQYADVSDLFCTLEVCPVVIGRNPVFRDDNHLSVAYAKTLEPVLGGMADQAMAPRS
jgi:peptidoglycan/LPS O-acetylase OafA/YrhL